ncbi:hypothetical protein [uncultured Algoriphagus sp.]|uniref:hypothetical protein n=1 Tax=uncultured Algoriphagus sp. TaxID=417365 RepID=UPI0025831CA5|nr:hypothetical protein [uncultured Algoriphagus sp.]
MLKKILASVLLIIWMLITMILGLTVLPGIIVFSMTNYAEMPSRLLKIISQSPKLKADDANK